MNALKDNGIPESALGIHLTIQEGKSPVTRVSLTASSEFQKKITVYLSPEKRGQWLSVLAVAIEMVEGEYRWPVHVDYENFTEYFPWNQLTYLEKRLERINIICHHVPPNVVTAEDIQKMQVEKEKADEKRRKARERYHSRLHTASSVQAEG